MMSGSISTLPMRIAVNMAMPMRQSMRMQKIRKCDSLFSGNSAVFRFSIFANCLNLRTYRDRTALP